MLRRSLIRMACLRAPNQVRRGMATATGTDSGDAKRAEVTLKRFWKAANLDERPNAFCVTLDKRPLKTAGGRLLEIPKTKRMLATLIAFEWDNQERLIKPYALPLTSLASRVIDDLHQDLARAEVEQALLRYLDTDSICFPEEAPEALVNLQARHWQPIIDWAQKEFNIEIFSFTGIFGSGQPPASKAKLEEVLSKLDAWELSGLERAVYASKSLLIGLALIHGRLSPEQAAQAAHVEVSSQIQRWGEVEDSHDVDYHDIRRQLGSVACLLAKV
ncbi:ATP12-domain-containing protein [Auriculariales sp. MPI-PUGE-AT-0066]|nr:ATP12-domain-containing protein [Auriculariales sp. MPI-PUGE-AT-0066]